MTSARSPNKGGFTLVEILAVMGMLALLFTIVVFSMSGGGEGQNMRIAATELRSALRFARQHAIANNTTCSVIFAFDPAVTEIPGKVARNRLYREGGSSVRQVTRDRFLRAYAVHSDRAESGGTGLISTWKFLPQGLVFDVDQKYPKLLNVLRDAECRTPVKVFNYSENPDSATDKTESVFAQAVTFRADGTMKFMGTSVPSARPVIYITEGSTNADDDFRNKLVCTYRVAASGARKYVSLLVPAYTGDAFMSMSPNLK